MNTKTTNWLSTKNIVLAALLAAFLIVPSQVENNYIISTLVYCFIFGALGVAWNLIGGYGAQISWCHAGFVATGAYTGILLNKFYNISPFMSVPVAMLIAYGFATLVGYGTLRLRGAYFSISTIAFAEILRILLLYFKGITNGSSGAFITYRGESFINLTFENDRPFYYISLVILILSLMFTKWFEKSKLGYYLGAIKGDEDAAISLGIPAFKIKLKAFQISAMMTAGIGVIFAFFLAYIDPTSVCSMDLSVKIGVVVIVGGIGHMWGPVIGSFVIIPLIEITGILLGQRGGSQILYGLALILIVTSKKDGIIGFFKKSEAK